MLPEGSGGSGTRWNRFWYRPVRPERLGLARLLFFGGLFLLYLPVDFSEWARYCDLFWYPVSLFRWLRVPCPSEQVLAVLQVVWKATLVTSAVGVVTRLSVPSAAVLSLFMFGLPQNFGKIDHHEGAVVLIMIVLAFSRCGDAWSFDSRRRPRRVSGEYLWPMRSAQVILALVFVGAGIAKLRYGGLAWFIPESASRILLRQSIIGSTPDWFVPLAEWIASHTLLATACLAFGALVELAYPMALASRGARRILVPGALVLLAGIRALMGPAFPALALCHVFWLSPEPDSGSGGKAPPRSADEDQAEHQRTSG